MLEKHEIIIGHFKQGKTQRRISREMGISRKTVKKHLEKYQRESAAGPQGLGEVKAPKYDSANRPKTSLIAEVKQLIDDCLSTNQKKAESGKHKQQMNARDMHEYLIEKGHQIGYTTVCNYVRTVRNQGKELFIRQQPLPGDGIEFDWGEVKLSIDGVEKRLMMAVFTCCYSNYRWSELFYRQDMSSFLESHVHFLEHLRFVPQRMIYDNMKVAVAKFSYRPQEKQATEELLKLSAYYQFAYRFCNARKGNEKGHVERSVEYVRRKSFCRQDVFESLTQANEHLQQKCLQLNKSRVVGSPQSIEQVMEEEKKQMQPARSPYDVGQYFSLRMDKYHCVSLDTNHYSVPETVTQAMVQVKVYPHRIQLYNQQQQWVATHERRHSKHQWYIQITHYLKQLKKKPGALAQSTALNQADQWLKETFEQHFLHSPKDFIELLQYQREKEIEGLKLRQAIEKCHQSSPNSAITLDKIKLIIEQVDPEPTNQKKSKTHAQDQGSESISAHCVKLLNQYQAMYQPN